MIGCVTIAITPATVILAVLLGCFVYCEYMLLFGLERREQKRS